MNHNDQQSGGPIQGPEELRAKQWTSLEDEIMQRALALWRRKGKEHVDALTAWRRAEREVLGQNGSASAKYRSSASTRRRRRK